MNLAQLQQLIERASDGDAYAKAEILRLKALSKRDRNALVAYNTLASLHWRRRSGPRWPKAERFYNRLMAKEKKAHATLRQVLVKARQGDKTAVMAFRMLKAIHHQRKASLFQGGEGAPQTGYYPMPMQHRVGIEFTPQAELTPEAAQNLIRMMVEARYSVPEQLLGTSSMAFAPKIAKQSIASLRNIPGFTTTFKLPPKKLGSRYSTASSTTPQPKTLSTLSSVSSPLKPTGLRF